MPRGRKPGSKPAAAGPSRLQAELANRILRLLHEQGVGAGYHLVELDLCRTFGVSRTPIRGALKQLADQGVLEARSNRGFVLRHAVTRPPEVEEANPKEEEEEAIWVALAKARNSGQLPDQVTQQEMLRILGVKLSPLLRVLHRLQELGLVERKPGNGWRFLRGIDSKRAQDESYAFRRIIEPAALTLPTFEIDREWLARSRAQHQSFLKRPWRDTLAVEFYQMNADFHEQLARASGNQYLLGAMQKQNQLRSFLNYHWVHGVERVHASVEEHLAILDALEAGDNEGARKLMLHHLDNSNSLYTNAGAEAAA
jgi:DNA-binding GntR family transcriptional regulator